MGWNDHSVPPLGGRSHSARRFLLPSAMLARRALPAALAPARALSSKSVRDVLDEKRSFRAGEDLKNYLKKHLELSTVEQGTSVAKVLDKMVTGEAHVLVVLDAKDKSIAGLVTDRDYIKLAHARNSGKEKRSDGASPRFVFFLAFANYFACVMTYLLRSLR